jgi:hypothetical protein
LVGRELYEKQNQHHKRNARVFLVEIQRRFPEPREYCPDWHRKGNVRGLVGIYYTVLRSLLRNQPHLRRYLLRCRHCWVFFLTDPRNAGREDIGCPFGCSEHHRRESSNKRSTEHNASAVGKIKRYQRKMARELAAALASAEASEAPDAHPGAMIPAGQAAGPPSLEEVPPSPRQDLPPPSQEPPAPLRDSTATIAETAVAERETRSIEVRGPDPSRELAPRPGDGLERAAAGDGEYDAGILRYVRTVVSLIEGRRVSPAEVLAMLQRTKRQHSFARERPLDHAVRRLYAASDKPP